MVGVFLFGTIFAVHMSSNQLHSVYNESAMHYLVLAFSEQDHLFVGHGLSDFHATKANRTRRSSHLFFPLRSVHTCLMPGGQYLHAESWLKHAGVCSGCALTTETVPASACSPSCPFLTTAIRYSVVVTNSGDGE